MTPIDPAVLIASIPLFASLPGSELQHLADTLQTRNYNCGDLLLNEGASDEHFYILLDGEVEVIKELGTADERLLGIKGGGALFGEMSLFDKQRAHTASVRAKTFARVMEMTRQDFDQLLHRYPKIAYEMVRQLSVRLEESENATILDLRQKNLQLRQAYMELRDAQDQLVIKEKLEQELAIARQIQESILPDTMPNLEGFDIAGFTAPARAVGGDYYDFIPLGEDRVGLVVGDACDKGIPAALFINLTNSLVHVEAQRNPSPESTLHMVNQHLIGMNRAGMFVTLLYGILNTSGQFDYCRAGHPHPIILGENLNPLNIVTGCGMPLGIMENVELDSRMVDIPPGGMLVIYSDGLYEPQDYSGMQYNKETLAGTLQGIGYLPAYQICSRLWEHAQEFTGGQMQYDDFTVVVVKREK